MDIENILSELYQIDPELKLQEADLRKFITLMIKNKPNINIDQKFVKELKSKLLATNAMPKKNKFNISTLALFSIPVASAAVILIAIIGVKYQNQSKISKIELTPQTYTMLALQERAFGELSLQSNNVTSPTSVASNPAISARPYGGGGFGGGLGAADSKMISLPNDGATVTYNYNGDQFELITDGEVMRRVKNNTSSASSTSNLLSSLGNLIDTKKISQGQVTRFQLVTNGDRGYFIDVDLAEGSIAMSENWQTWPHPESACVEQSCFDSYRMTIEQILADDEIISIANNFVSTYGVNTSSLGAPVISNEWRAQYDLAAIKSEIYLPDTFTVTYPYQYNKQNIIDESGNPYGVQVNVNVRLKAVTGMYNLTSQNYETSAYTLETSNERIIAAAKKGGLFPQYSIYGIEQKTLDVQLGKPTIGYVKMWFYANNIGNELLVPAYIFPVLNQLKADMYFRKQIIVPAVKEVLDQLETQNSTGGTLIEPRI